MLAWNNTAGCWEPQASGGSPDTSVYLTRATDQAGTDKYLRSTTGNDTYVASVTPALTAYTRGGCFVLDADTANTGPATININGLGAKSILNRASGALSNGDITANAPITICYDGTQFIVQGDGGSGSGATSVSGLTDLQVTKTSDDVATIAAGNVRCLESSGLRVVTALSSGTVTRSSGTASDTIRYAVNCNSGSPILAARIGTSITLGNYSCVNVTCTSGNAYLVGDFPLATIVVTSGVNGTPTELRALSGAEEYTAGTGITKTGNVFSLGTFTLKTKIPLPLVGCAGTTAALMWDTLASLAPTATCSAGSTNTDMIRGVADWPDSDGDYSVQYSIPMPDDWDTSANLDAVLKWRTTATSGDIVWQVQTACRADAEVDDVAWNTASTVTDTAKGTANQLNDAAITNITKTGCAAGEKLRVRVLRNRTHASDTLAAVASLDSVEFTVRRSIVP